MWWHHTGTISDRLEVMFLFSWLLVSPACMGLGYSYAELEQGALEYIKKGMSAVLLSLLVGGTISTWTAARTDLSIIYYGLRYIKPDTFLMAAFFLNLLLCSVLRNRLGYAGDRWYCHVRGGRKLWNTPALTVGAVSAVLLWEKPVPLWPPQPM